MSFPGRFLLRRATKHFMIGLSHHSGRAKSERKPMPSFKDISRKKALWPLKRKLPEVNTLPNFDISRKKALGLFKRNLPKVDPLPNFESISRKEALGLFRRKLPEANTLARAAYSMVAPKQLGRIGYCGEY